MRHRCLGTVAAFPGCRALSGCRIEVRRRGELELATIPRTDEEETLTHLWNAVVGTVENGPLERVVRADALVNPINRPPQQVERLILAAIGQAEDVLEEKRFRLKVPKNTQVGGEGVGPRII